MRIIPPIALLLVSTMVAGCPSNDGVTDVAKTPPAFVDAGRAETDEIPSIDRRIAFDESRTSVSALLVGANPGDFGGNKLYDGFELTVQPLDGDDNAVKKIGSLTVTAYAFNVKTKSGKGRELMRWFVPTSRMMDAWGDVGLDEGYRIRLTWDHRPKVTYIVLEVTFKQLDGRTWTVAKSPISIEQTRYKYLLE